LIDDLADNDPKIRILAAAFIYDIARIEDTLYIQPLITALNDPEELVRRNAGGTLGRLKDREFAGRKWIE
jgi:HEAT repeat protein